MLNLFFGNITSTLTSIIVLLLLLLIVTAFIKHKKIDKWGKLILVLILAGTAVSGLSATRDAFMTETALFSLYSLQSAVCSIAGGLIFITGVITLFVKNQKFRKINFRLISILFIIQVMTIESSRIILTFVGSV